MDEKVSSTLLYRRRARDGTLLEPLLDRATPLPQSSWPQEPSTTPDYQSWLNKPNENHWPQRGRIDGALAQTRDMEDVRPGFVRDGWSPEPSGRQSTGGIPAQTTFVTLDMTFLEWFPRGDATVSYPDAHGGVETVYGISQGLIEDRSFLLSQSFEGNRLHLEAVGPDTARPLLQYIYTGAYSLPTPAGEAFEDVPTSLLIHCRMYHLAVIYDIGDLRTFANAAIIRQCEFGCSSPDKPIDLVPAIDYVYNNMPEQKGVIETIIAYCVSCFLTHALADDYDFRRLAFDLRPFHQDLAKVSFERRFDNDEVAQAVIKMPFRPYVPVTYASREDRRAIQVFDHVYHFHGDDGCPPTKKRQLSEHGGSIGAITLALRTKSRNTRSPEIPAQDNVLDENAGTAPISEDPKSLEWNEYTTRPLGVQQKRWQKNRAANIVEEKETTSWANEESIALTPSLFPDKGKRPLRVVNYTPEERIMLRLGEIETSTEARRAKHSTFGALVENDTSPTKLAGKEPGTQVSRKLFNKLVSAGLTGKPGPSYQAVSPKSNEYLRVRGSSQEVQKMCAALAKEELDEARLEAERKSKASPIVSDRKALQPLPKSPDTRDGNQDWKIPPPMFEGQDARFHQFMKDMRKSDRDAREEVRQKSQLQQKLADQYQNQAVLDSARLEVRPQRSLTDQEKDIKAGLDSVRLDIQSRKSPTDQEKAVPDSDYEVIPGPARIEVIDSDSDSDSDPMKVEYSPSMVAQDAQPLRDRNPDIKSEDHQPDVGQTSDSEWNII